LEYRVVLDYGDKPLEIFDGIEPLSLLLTPAACRLNDSYHSIDLIAEIANRNRKDPLDLRYANLYDVIPVRVVVVNKSSNKKESVLGYLGIIPKVDGTEERIVLFSFFEASPERFQCYIHKLFQ